jgi:O-acetyl-ADP-ribose deacetylase (regulator of RNase III)
MIRYVQGDILLSKAQLLAHGVAPNDDFRQGLALSLRENWPAMYKDFRHYCQTSHPEPGGLWVWAGAGGVRIANLLTQESAYDHGAKPGKASTTHVNHSLRELRRLIDAEGFQSVALPRLATGVGSLEWDQVKPLIENHLADAAATVDVYETYVPGQAA